MATKEKMWVDAGYGPWAFMADGCVAGRGSLQPEGDDVDLGIVLHPDYWGMGKAVLDRLIVYDFNK